MTRRIIKFRFWCDAAKGFIQDYNYNGAVDDLFNDEDPLLFPTQYTGCNDYEKKEIWEGDIVEFEKKSTEVSGKNIVKAVIDYQEGGFVARIINPQGTLSFIHLYSFYGTYKFTSILRVVGNKFQNNELIK